MLPLNFANPEDYEKVQPTDHVDLVGIEKLAPASKVTMVCKHKDGSKDEIELTHTFNGGQSELLYAALFLLETWTLMPIPFLPSFAVEWFKHGSALNLMGKNKSA